MKPREIVDAKVLMDQMIKRLQAGVPDRELQDLDRAFARGWHMGWLYACQVILDELPDQGASSSDIYRMVALFEDKILEWRRNVGSPDDAPRLNKEDYQEEVQEDENK